MPTSWRTAALAGGLLVLVAVAIGLAGGRLLRPAAPTPRQVTVTFSPVPTPSPTPYDEVTLFKQPLSAGCATPVSIWLVTNGGGLLRFDGSQWAQVDSTLRSLTDVACSATTAYAVGLIGTIVVGDETSRQIRATDIGIEDLHGVATVGDGALMVGTNGSVFILAGGEIQPYARGIDEDLNGVVAFTVNSAWAVGAAGITYRLDNRGWNPVGSGQTNTLRAVSGTTAASVVAVGDAGTVVVWIDGQWRPARSGVDVALRDVISTPGLFIVGDKGTLLTTAASPDTPLRKIDLRTDCDLLSVFARGPDVFVVGRNVAGGGVWRIRDGAVAQHFGGC
ncbi:MAG: hypothetical protein AUH85_08120 [Chloroflexi bacterium 13_1_40CM_4_68_4]|nr:MAG: hypothetical protein AUH85_08120 [Chloroflexi bacterium 13_1_40CM_4_68_4]